MKISLHAIFRFDMSQLNLNNFQTDRATGLCLDSKDAPFQTVSEFDFIGFRFYKCMLVFFRTNINSSFFLIEVVDCCNVKLGGLQDSWLYKFVDASPRLSNNNTTLPFCKRSTYTCRLQPTGAIFACDRNQATDGTTDQPTD